MSKRCFICGKNSKSGNNVSHSKRHTKRMWLPNLQNINILVEGKKRKKAVCTKCIKGGKVIKAVKAVKAAK
ncbi:50S ribosomal protein L28 [candidate division WOR-1 bacterium RIFOXYB2_FULL_42_35]|uniref:Large ribosomal subunit protein bL28 n=1 Tax=candidate division WOR-1 bacterium RIFOXYC2_FULL_41_25 TaxID=1802586 RepID=A0A1F4TL23_UNCSA|nr:MAG: 50S ribosomal protein L28 [candidate division WOR-1 bacterium RIFOXYA2_FULL_41_14]OGC22492.1 MAG: 50S ribosomal protein L28 [candidate division WOR-1 bacterium RIFOXYB2_FULL_42_35]OGC33230.1 MAG: 50S ribosomal protein L28 [candidate division WOR-1 bacterium RIFOXYC2_FULL_41_25]OGC43485.1 MAG: 50S ribosomal protein L28 [candidate division WOR-1 bacterium RIFOXYD2_FULL_41_8]